MQYIFSVPESMGNNYVIVSFNFIMPQNLKAKDRTFPLKSEVFKVRQHASGLCPLRTFLYTLEKATS